MSSYSLPSSLLTAINNSSSNTLSSYSNSSNLTSTSTSSSPFKLIETTLKVALLPIHTEYPFNAIKEQINDMLFRYNDDLNGVPILYDQLTLPKTKEYGRIMNELPWLHIDISTKILLFQPQSGQILTGQINKISDSHIALLVFGLFNASILETELNSNLNYDSNTNSWKNEEFNYSEGDNMVFRVNRCHHSHGIFYIEGSPMNK